MEIAIYSALILHFRIFTNIDMACLNGMRVHTARDQLDEKESSNFSEQHCHRFRCICRNMPFAVEDQINLETDQI